jgi:glycolate oxidase FAD binding subunit
MDPTRGADLSEELLARVREALAAGTPLRLDGGGSKGWYGRSVVGATPLDLRGHRGILSYDPSELVVTVRAGTALAALEAALDAEGQMLACEPPHYAGGATVGGTIASGLSGPRRPWAGSVRDFVLGCRVITGHGRHLRFGGQVMKNVAGYDVSRLMAGSLGCLGIVTEVSLKVLPKPRATLSLRIAMGRAAAMQRFAEWGRQPLPISAASHDGEAVLLRLEGGEGSVDAARRQLGGEEAQPSFWTGLRDHGLPFFADPRPLWRLSVPAHRCPLSLPGDALIDWGGAQVWLKTDAGADAVRAAAAAAGGHAQCFTPGAADSPLHPLPEALKRYHRQLKAQLDPHGVFNPGRMYEWL